MWLSTAFSVEKIKQMTQWCDLGCKDQYATNNVIFGQKDQHAINGVIFGRKDWHVTISVI